MKKLTWSIQGLMEASVGIKQSLNAEVRDVSRSTPYSHVP
jgi:hypothetical protein